MASLMINEFWCKRNKPEDDTLEYAMLYALSSDFDYVGGIQKGDKLICDFSATGGVVLWEVIDPTRAIFKNPDIPSEKAYLDTVKRVAGVVKTPETTETTDEEEDAAPIEGE